MQLCFRDWSLKTETLFGSGDEMQQTSAPIYFMLRHDTQAQRNEIAIILIFQHSCRVRGLPSLPARSPKMKKLSLAAALAASAICALAATTSDFNHAIDFDKYHTYLVDRSDCA